MFWLEAAFIPRLKHRTLPKHLFKLNASTNAMQQVAPQNKRGTSPVVLPPSPSLSSSLGSYLSRANGRGLRSKQIARRSPVGSNGGGRMPGLLHHRHADDAPFDIAGTLKRTSGKQAFAMLISILILAFEDIPQLYLRIKFIGIMGADEWIMPYKTKCPHRYSCFSQEASGVSMAAARPQKRHNQRLVHRGCVRPGHPRACVSSIGVCTRASPSSDHPPSVTTATTGVTIASSCFVPRSWQHPSKIERSAAECCHPDCRQAERGPHEDSLQLRTLVLPMVRPQPFVQQ